MSIPGQRRSLVPDKCGLRAGQFAEAIRDGAMETAWELLSKESVGLRQGIWATQNGIDLQLVYRVAHNPDHPMFAIMMSDFRSAVLKYWPLEDLDHLAVAPTSYVDDHHAFAFLPVSISGDQEIILESTEKAGIVIPMLFEDGDWRVDLPGWRFS